MTVVPDEVEASSPVIAEVVAPPPIAISFRNPLAVRIGLFLALLTFLLLVLLGPFIVLWMLVAGGLAAWIYRMRTGELVTLAAGARLGWITGMFTFVILMVVISLAALMLTDQTFVDTFISQMSQRGSSDTARQVVSALQSPGKLAGVLVETFIFCGILPVLGGLLGAKLFGRPRAL